MKTAKVIGYIIAAVAIAVAAYLAGVVWMAIKTSRPSAEMVPTDAYLYLSLNINPKDPRGQAVRDAFVGKSDDPKWQLARSLLISQLGVEWISSKMSYDEAFLSWLGDEIAIYQEYPSSRSPYVFLVKVKNRVLFDRMFVALKDEVARATGRITERTYKKVSIVGIQVESEVNSAFMKGYWVVSKSQLAISNLIDAVKGDKKSLAQDDKFTYLALQLGKDYALQGVFDLKSLLARMIETGYLLDNPLLARMMDNLETEKVGFGIKTGEGTMIIDVVSYVQSAHEDSQDDQLYRYIPADALSVWSSRNLKKVAETNQGLQGEGNAVDGTNFLAAMIQRSWQVGPEDAEIPNINGGFAIARIGNDAVLLNVIDESTSEDQLQELIKVAARYLGVEEGAETSALGTRLSTNILVVGTSEEAVQKISSVADGAIPSLAENSDFAAQMSLIDGRSPVGYLYWDTAEFDVSSDDALTTRGSFLTLLRNYGKSIVAVFEATDIGTNAKAVVSLK